MSTIIKKGTNPSAFRLHDKVLVLEPNVITVITEKEMDELKHKWWGFIEPRIITEKNPYGCFIISDKSINYADGFNREIGKVEDGSMPIQTGKIKQKKKNNK